MTDDEPTLNDMLLSDGSPLRADFDLGSMPDTADAPGNRRKEDRIDREFREQAEFWDFVFRSRIGRYEIWKLLSMGHPFEARFMAGPSGFPDPLATWYAQGEQQLALRQFQTLERANQLGVWKMREEHDPRLSKPGRQSKTSK